MAWLAVMCLCATGAAAQGRNLKEENKRRDQRLNDPGRYARMLDAYLAADTAHSVDLLADPEWDEKRLRMFQNFMDYGGGTYWPPTRWAAAAMMHIDVALKLSPSLESAAALLHFDVASVLLGLGVRERKDAVSDFAERIYVALARMLEDHIVPYSAENVLRVARERVPDRASILYASGALAEMFGTDYALAGTAGLSHGFDFEQVVRQRAGYLNDAAAWLRRAAELDAANDLLRVHLGRVQALRREDDEAALLLDRVLGASDDDATAYVAGVFIGGLRERQGRLDDAAAAYRAAMARFPVGHAAYVGLSEVLQRAGKADEAREVLRNLLSEAIGPTREPLWWYQYDPPGVAEARLDALRSEVRR